VDNLENWISKEEDTEELLLLCHTTKWKYFEKIIKENKLSTIFSKYPDPNPWKKKEEDLIYLFYGLPFYIYETGEGNEINCEVTEDLPIGLIFKSDLALETDRFYPFDTGALLSNRYKGLLDIENDADLNTYKVNITNGIEMKKLVKRYYQINEKYCYGIFDNSISTAHAKEENLVRLFRQESKSEIDLRNRAIEVHSLKDINISENLIAIIFPRVRTNKYQYIKNGIEKLSPNIDIRYYNDLTRYNSESIRNALLEATMSYYNEKHPTLFSYDRLEAQV